MTIGSLFSGIGGLELGLEWAGLGPTVWQVEKDERCRQVLKQHWPEAKRFGDVESVGAQQLRPVDLICGGFPCQDISSAGKGAGLAGARSGLWREFARIISEVRPAWAVIENVASGANRWVDTVVSELGLLDYEALSIPLSAEDVGAGHRRARIFIVARAMGRPDRERGQLRQQPRRRRGKGRKDSLQPAVSGPHEGWPPEFEVAAPLHGAPPELVSRLGNAVVPQCAEVIGWMIRELDALGETTI